MKGILSILVISLLVESSEQLSHKTIRTIFTNVMAKPSFDASKVVGEPWVIVYTWNQRLYNSCVEFRFKNVTKRTIERVRGRVGKYLRFPLPWERAVLKMTFFEIGILLMSHPGPPGLLSGVEMNMYSKFRDYAKTYRYAFNQLNDKYMVRMNCDTGISALLQRKGSIDREGVDKLAETLPFGYGHPACY